MTRLFFMPAVFTVFAFFTMFTMRSFSGRILMKPLNIVSVLDIGLNKLATLGDTFILVHVQSGCMIVTFPDPCSSVIGDQLHQRIG